MDRGGRVTSREVGGLKLHQSLRDSSPHGTCGIRSFVEETLRTQG